MPATTTTPVAAPPRSPDEFDVFAEIVRRRVRAAAESKKPLFVVSPSESMWAAYLDGFATPEARQLHNCNCCRHFIERYGNVVTLVDNAPMSILWAHDAPNTPTYTPIAARLAEIVRRAQVVGVFYSAASAWGAAPSIEGWTHFHLPAPSVYRNALISAGQAMSEKREQYGMVRRALADYSIDVVRKAAALLRSDALYRSEKVLGGAEWLLKLHEDMAATNNTRARDNVVWAAVATAPAGFCHVRTSMIASLLDDLVANLDHAEVARRFGEKMNPLAYMRPKSAPSEGQITQAEKVIEKLNSAGSLARRFARLEDLQTIWRPREAKPAPEKSGGVFQALRKDGKSEPIHTGAPPQTMTWVKFADRVLPSAEKIELRVPRFPHSFIGLTAAANPDAPPILQWDREDKRNTVGWYFYEQGSRAADWGLVSEAYCVVDAITRSPAKWDAAYPRQNIADMAIFVLHGARDLKHTQGGGLFVEHLRSEYHGIRATLEAHIATQPIAGRDEGTANGIAIQAGSLRTTLIVRVTAGGVVTDYALDRFD